MTSISTSTISPAKGIPAAAKGLTFRRLAIWLAATAGILLLGVAGLGIRMATMTAPADLDFSTTRTSDTGAYRMSYAPAGQSIKVNQIHRWTVHLETNSGAPVDGAVISVDGGMPQHGHGLPTVPKVTRSLGHGDYEVEGMKFNMGGWWVVHFDIDSGGLKDRVTFNLNLE